MLIARYLSLITLIFTLLAHGALQAAPIAENLVFSLTDSNQKIFFCARLTKGNVHVVKKKSKYIKWKTIVETTPNISKKLVKKLKKRNKLCKQYTGGGGDDTGESPADLTPVKRVLTREDVQYLLDKAGLGLSEKEDYLVSIAINQGIEALVDNFMAIKAEPNGLINTVEDLLDGQLNASTNQTPAGQREALIHLWINTNNAFSERLALFLLSIWTVSGDVIEDETFRSNFWDYYQRLRTAAQAEANMKQLAIDVTSDPLMLVYLNNERNIKGNPNENYARELQELFTLGPSDLDGNANYSETNLDGSGDIATAAKMLTGWKVNKDYTINKLVSVYDQSRHQTGPHTMYPNKAYSFTGENYEDLILGIFEKHPNVKIYYAKEILKEYLTPDPPKDLIESLARVVENNDYKLRPVLATLFKSEAFYAEAYKNTVTTNPMEFIAKTSRILKLFNGGVNLSTANWQISNMGMQFNMAPSVFWYPANNWSGATALLEKANTLAAIYGDSTAQASIAWTPATVLPDGNATKEQVLDHVISKLGINLSSPQKENVFGFMSQIREYDGSFTQISYDNTNADHQELKGLGLYYLLFSSKDYQLK